MESKTTVKVIENKTGQTLSFKWDGNVQHLPPGKHIVSELWPGREEYASAAVQQLTADDVRNKVLVYDAPATVTLALEVPPEPAVSLPVVRGVPVEDYDDEEDEEEPEPTREPRRRKRGG